MYKRSIKNIVINNQELRFETGAIARQANGAVILTCGETVIMATACVNNSPKENVDFFPFSVHYQEKFSSAGKTLGGYLKREGRPTERETLISRFIDRPLRPMFPEGYYNEVQLIASVLSYDTVHSPDALGICAASAALLLSDIPFDKPVAGVRVGYVEGRFIVNPTEAEQEKSKLDLILAGTDDAILMIEGYCNFFTEEQVIEAIETGHHAIKEICHALSAWKKEIGKEKNTQHIKKLPQALLDQVEEQIYHQLPSIMRIAVKQERENASSAMRSAAIAAIQPEGSPVLYSSNDIQKAFKVVEARYLRQMILNDHIRCDGRKTDEIRPIMIEQNLLPRVHGSSLFTRGETQTIAVCTLGGESMSQRFETLTGEGKRRFYLQYFFPPYSVGETGRMGPPGRREVGHGKLAERSLLQTLPPIEKFPYTIRVESNITESNGSSSMASVCGGCLAMMDAGIPIERPISGIAMGLILEGDRYAILSDILGLEDALGDMDFKVTGDESGVTAFQMDIKVEGITVAIMQAALAQAKKGRVHILNCMKEVVPTYRKELSKHAPRLATIKVKSSQIGTVIGPGGKMIRSIVEETGVEIDIDDDGVVSISSTNSEGVERALQIIRDLTAEVEPGATYNGKVTKITDFGAFVEILPNQEGLLHVSEYDWARIDHISNHLREGEMVSVKVLEVDDRGKMRLSRKALLPKPEGFVEEKPRERTPRDQGSRDHSSRPGNDRRPAPRR